MESFFGVLDDSPNPVMKEVNGKQLKASVVFAAALKWLKEHALDKINQAYPDTLGIEDEKVLWVVTVPAIWSTRAKRVMRKVGILGISFCPSCFCIARLLKSVD